jgi:putative DNA primase/helicase
MDFFTFRPAFKLMFIGNHRPVLHNVDAAARRRFAVVPFTRKPANPDRDLEAKLRAEWPGILRWMIEGCLDWQVHGLQRPAIVATTTDAYFAEQDLTGQWIEDECDAEIGNEHKWELTGRLFAAWSSYAMRAGEKAGNKKSFSEAMQRRGFQPHRTTSGRTFRFIRLQSRETHGMTDDG